MVSTSFREGPRLQTGDRRDRPLVAAPRRDLVMLYLLVMVLVSLPESGASSPTPLPSFDFTTPSGAQGWQPTHDIARLELTPDGLRIHIAGSDPYSVGPARNYPHNQRLWLHLRLKSDEGGSGQVFYFTDVPTEAASVRFSVGAGMWEEVAVPMPSLGSGFRLRLDPPGTKGTCVVSKLWFEARNVFALPEWPSPLVPEPDGDWLHVTASRLSIRHSPRSFGEFEVSHEGRRLAIGYPQAPIGYILNDTVRWTSPFGAADGNIHVTVSSNRLVVATQFRDPDAAQWQWEQTFTVAAADSIHVETRVTVDQDRSVLHLPWFMLFAGVGTHGTNKNQALFAGVEYLDNEPSSSEADLAGPASWRLVPDTAKLTMPLMALSAEQHYFGLHWEPQPGLCAVHDSPDRQFGSGGHVMGLLSPGSDGFNREERSLLPYRPEVWKAGESRLVRATLFAGRGTSMIPALQHYVRLRGLPPLPDHGYDKTAYFELAARGWLDSRIRDTNLFRHAWWTGFNPQPAADAALWMTWLASRVSDPKLASALIHTAANALTPIAPARYNQSQIGHVVYPAPALVFGGVLDNATEAARRFHELLQGFRADGSVTYEPPARGTDYSRTHRSREANGLTAARVVALLEAAVFSGDVGQMEKAVDLVRAMTKFRGGVPRGAQTWEIPLHTPDILAAAHLVRAFTLAFELTGEADLLLQAQEWAWTGLPFVYLTAPTPRPIGLYSTIAVLGATGWVAPVWLGQPVQWCGLVYADALYRLSPHDPAGPWKHLADGIASAGIQHTWPSSDSERQGLLPDFFLLKSQRRDGPAINPATLLPSAARLLGEQPPYSFHAFLRHGLGLHVPGSMKVLEEQKQGLAFEVHPAAAGRARILITGLQREPAVKLDLKTIELNAPHQFQATEGRLVLVIDRPSRIDLAYPAIAFLEIRSQAVTGEVRLAWPVAASGFELEMRPSLGTAFHAWQPVGSGISVEGSSFVAQHPIDSPHAIYRLSRFGRVR